MGYILHASDFHFTNKIADEIQKLYDLADYLKKYKIQVDYFVFTGDLIDSRVISDECGNTITKKYRDLLPEYDHDKFEQYILEADSKSSGIIEEYNSLLINKTTDQFKRAEKYVIAFINKLGLSIDTQVILCCGNHDKMRLVFHKGKSICKEGDYHMSENDPARFAAFDHFCHQLGLSYGHNSSIIPAKGIDFIILNSNWDTPADKKGCCINCPDIKNFLEVIDENKMIIAAAHAPIKNLCEHYLYTYPPDPKGSLQKAFEKKIDVYLCGDKHTVHSDKHNDVLHYMCGAPLYKEGLIYNLIHYNENKDLSCNHLRWEDGRWHMDTIKEAAEESYRLSKEYMTDNILFILNENTITLNTLELAMEALEKSETNRINIASNIFKASCKYKEHGNEYMPWPDANIFELVYDKISTSDLQNPLNIKGNNNSGKSIFLNIQYLYLLDKYRKGDLCYIPVYFNVENIEIEKKYLQSTSEAFFSFINACEALSQKTSMPVFYLIDGLDNQNCYSKENALESRIYECLKDIPSCKFICSFNTYAFPKLRKTSELYDENSHIIYFKSVDIMPMGTEQNRFELFVRSYLNLRGIENSDQQDPICQVIKKYRKININLDFLHSNFEDLQSEEVHKLSSWETLLQYNHALGNRCKQIFMGRNIDKQLQKAAYLLAFKGMVFSQIRKRCNRITYEHFLTIKKNDEIRNYLIAKYYINQLSDEAKKTQSVISKDSILYEFIPRNIAVLIRLNFSDDSNNLESICTALAPKLDGQAFSMLIYLLGHLKIENGKKRNLLNRIINSKCKCGSISASSFTDQAVERSLCLANIICHEPSNRKLTQSLLHSLIKDPDLRMYYRIYQLLYYGDISLESFGGIDAVKDETDIVRNGFDFHNCFHTLISKLEFEFEHKRYYYFMELDLLTLCDIIYSRLLCKECKDNNGRICDTFFYNKDYNNRCNNHAIEVLTKTRNAIELFLNEKIYHGGLQKTDSIYVYFHTMKETFKEAIELLEGKTAEDKNALYIRMHPSHKLIQLMELEGMHRIGWIIDHKAEFNEEERMDYIARCKEEGSSIPKEGFLEHIFESACIALLYLPEKLKKKDIYERGSDEDAAHYNKGNVLKYIFIHEFGKHKTGDFTPDTKERNRLIVEERLSLLSTLLMGATKDFADMSNYYDLIENAAENSSDDINNIIAQDLNAIQRGFKFAMFQSEGRLAFKKDRKEDFQNSIQFKTVIGRQIYEMLVGENPRFKSRL